MDYQNWINYYMGDTKGSIYLDAFMKGKQLKFVFK